MQGSWNATFRSESKSDRVDRVELCPVVPVEGARAGFDQQAELRLAAGQAGRDALPNWNLHPNDARNLTDYVSGLPKWPKLLTYQELDLDKVGGNGSVRDLLQAPILYLAGWKSRNLPRPR